LKEAPLAQEEVNKILENPNFTLELEEKVVEKEVPLA